MQITGPVRSAHHMDILSAITDACAYASGRLGCGRAPNELRCTCHTGAGRSLAVYGVRASEGRSHRRVGDLFTVRLAAETPHRHTHQPSSGILNAFPFLGILHLSRDTAQPIPRPLRPAHAIQTPLSPSALPATSVIPVTRAEGNAGWFCLQSTRQSSVNSYWTS